MKNFFKKTVTSLLVPVGITLVLLSFLTAVSNFNQEQATEGRKQLEDAITKAAVSCYAAEGIYPPDLPYLIDHYGIQINTKQYTVVYESIASNLMPDITVLEN